MTAPTIAINALQDELDESAAVCRAENLGLEITAFAFPSGLDDGFEERVRNHRTTLAGIAPLSLHGPFLDLYPASVDPAIVQVCRQRHERAFEAAAGTGASVYVAHLSSVPLIRNKRYREHFVSATVKFWLPFADWAAPRGITIVLENLWEAGPELQKAVIEAAQHRALKASFDNGHALIFSDLPASHWIEVLGSDLAHCHLLDNGGEYDEHRPLGQGCEDWPAVFRALRTSAPEALIVLESDKLAANRESLEQARRFLETSDAP